jgi:hypothetical protein
MYPTLKPGDGIQLETGRGPAAFRRGDVIVYSHPVSATDVVHRIVRTTPQGVVTRGDNNSRIDPWEVRYVDIAGKVVAARRGARLIPVRGAMAGLLIHKLMLLRKYGRHYGLMPLRGPARWLAASRMLNWLHPLFKTRIIYIRQKGRTAAILTVGGRTAGKYRPESGAWEIRFPYKLFIDPSRLAIRDLSTKEGEFWTCEP